MREIESYLKEVRERPKHRRSRLLSAGESAISNGSTEQAKECSDGKHPLQDTRVQLMLAAVVAMVLLTLGHLLLQ